MRRPNVPLSLNANNAINSVKAGQAKEGGNAADQAGGVGISISVGSSSSQAKQSSSADSAKGSSLNAGGNVSIQATGAGKDSDINAGGKASLKAEDQVSIVAAQNTSTEFSRVDTKASNVLSDQNLNLVAGCNVKIEADQNTSTSGGLIKIDLKRQTVAVRPVCLLFTPASGSPDSPCRRRRKRWRGPGC